MFNIHQTIYDKHGELDERRTEKYIDGLMEQFAASPEAQPIIEQYGNVCWAGMMMEYDFSYLGVPIPDLSLPDFDEAQSLQARYHLVWFQHRQLGHG